MQTRADEGEESLALKRGVPFFLSRPEPTAHACQLAMARRFQILGSGASGSSFTRAAG